MSNSGRFLATGGEDRKLKLWNLRRGLNASTYVDPIVVAEEPVNDRSLIDIYLLI